MSGAAPQRTLRIAITLGDPRGIGPEVAAAAAHMYRAAAPHHLIFIGPRGTGAETAADEFIHIGEWSTAPGAGGDMATAGRLAGLAIDHAIDLALHGGADAVVTAPIDKAALHAGGYDFPGHTEMLASRCGMADVVMMMAAERTALGGPLRVVLATTHIALAQVPAAFTPELLITQTRITARALRAGWRIASPRIALCAFNPHASDGGLFGDEEERIYAPAVRQLRADGHTIAGPVPADTVFLRAARGEFDAVIAPYHDVGMAAFKTAAFGSGVNVTLGLPFPRTSPDHGTALDRAGRATADPSSMLEALHLATHLASVQASQPQMHT
ncbi:MAG TPA: 4-hydroxythreonine-4-phosphate dehydrogenase PdxA [Longimicrobiales bacterium]|nr:4-hydroxythreonine-4-phosphate dehydrogenase PdxA [Longimicrobiales bacterium]